MEEKAGHRWLGSRRSEKHFEDGYFVDEFTQVGYVARVGFLSTNHTMITLDMRNSGYGYATALGVKVAHPDKAVVS